MTRRDIRNGCMESSRCWLVPRRRPLFSGHLSPSPAAPQDRPRQCPTRGSRGSAASGIFKHAGRKVHAKVYVSSRQEFGIMVKASAIVLLSLALAGCAAGPQARLADDPAFQPARYAWDGAGQDPNRPQLAAGPSLGVRSAIMSDVVKPGQSEDDAAATADTQLKQSLVICKGCLRPQPPAEDARVARAAD
jgi:hypothetical protein